MTSSGCRVCGGVAAPAELLAPLPFLTCRNCGFTFREDRRADEVHAIYRTGSYTEVRGAAYSQLDTLDERRRHACARLDWLMRHVRSGRLLDVGAAGGAFVEQALARGFAAEGIEPTPSFAAFARERLGVSVRTTTVEDADLADGAFDVATMWHVLEHVPYPVAVLSLLRRAIRSGGVIAIEVPNAGGHIARTEGSEWASLEPEVHVNQFDRRSLRTALECAGFDPIELESTTITPYLAVRERLRPGYVAHRMRSTWRLRTARLTHPDGHELLRALARPRD